jgi:hypothetical protein
MADATKDFEELLGCLKRHEARFVVVGAHAVAYHAKPRYTKDFDLLIDPDVVNGERVVAALEEVGFAGLGIVPEDFASTDASCSSEPPNWIDMMTSIDGIDFDEVRQGRVEGSRRSDCPVHRACGSDQEQTCIATSSGPRRSGAVAGHEFLIASQAVPCP